MPPLHCPNAWTAVAKWTTSDETWTNSYGVDVGVVASLTQGAADDLAGALHDAVNSNIKALIADNVTLTELKVTDVRTLGAPQYVGAINLACTNTGHMLPTEVVVPLSLRTAYRGPRGRGRMYISGVSADGNTDAGQLDAGTYKAGILAFGNDLMDAMHALSWDLGVISRAEPGIGFNATIRPVSSVFVHDSVWKSQRTRRVRV